MERRLSLSKSLAYGIFFTPSLPLSLPLSGALVGWLILRDQFGPLVYGVSFGIIAGMMIYISLKELLPTALTFDKKSGLIVPIFLGLGMAVMALSLLLFLY